MVKRIKQINELLPILWISIVCYGVICQIVGVFFINDRQHYSIGLWIGIATACGGIYHMAWVLSKAFDNEWTNPAQKMLLHTVLRYLAIVIVLAMLLLTGFGNPLAAFLGIMGMKVASYAQIVLQRKKVQYEVENCPCDPYDEDADMEEADKEEADKEEADKEANTEADTDIDKKDDRHN